MNKNFKAYTPITERQIDAVWRKSATLFILDTNILLNLYSYRKNTQEDFFRILEKLKDRIWIPYHVMLEYHRNRLKVINDKENTINEIIKWCKDMRLEFPNDLLEKKDEKNIPQIFKDFSRKYPDLKNEWDKIKKDINNTFSKNKERYIERIKQVTDNGIGINNHDKVYDSLKEILINIGTAYDENFIENIKKIGKERYSHKRPPGYKDVSKDQDEDNVYYHNGCAIPYKYGDLIIWEEIKRYVNNGNNPLKIQNIVFVTDDNKDDWVQKHYSGEKTISMARYELFDELLTEAKHISHFLIADAESFVKQSNKHFNLKLDDGSVNDIKNTANNSRIFSTNQDIIEIINNRFEKTSVNPDSLNFRPRSFKSRKYDLIEQINSLKDEINFVAMLLSESRSREEEINLRRRLLKLESRLYDYSKELKSLDSIDKLDFYKSTIDRSKEE